MSRNERFSVELTRRAQKDLENLRGFEDRVIDVLVRLEDDPRRGHTLSSSLLGARSLEYSLPGGAYRAAYVILEDEQICLVFMIGPHENFYREATRRMEAL